MIMSTRNTSRQAYRDLEGRGILRGIRLEVYAAFERFGAGTSAEVLHRASMHGNLNLMRARVTELADAGVLVEVTERKCTRTGRQAIVYRSLEDGEQPVPRVKPIKVAFSIDDIAAIAAFQSGTRGQFCPNLERVHRKILDSLARPEAS
jgi:hypothetical protein